MIHHPEPSPEWNAQNGVDFDFKVLYYIHDREYNFRSRHSHKFCELVVVREGSAEHTLDGMHNRIHPGSVFFMRPGEQHYYSRANKLGIYNILFSSAFIEKIRRDLPAESIIEHLFSTPRYAQHSLSGDPFRRLLALLDEVLDEQRSNQPGARIQILADALKILLLVSRFARLPDAGSTCDIDYRISRLLEKIGAAPAEPWPLERMSRFCGLSESGFRRNFLRVTGSSPIRHLLTLRLEKAAQLLQEQSLSIAETAEKCGFSDSNYFARCFHREFNCSPRAYRRRERRP